MCGRYLTPEESDLERAWGLSPPDGYIRSWNFAPSQLAPVLRPGAAGELSLDMLVWGFRPHWAKRAWINARSETVFSSRAFAESARHKRCLVPALGWYEWQGEKPPRQPWLFHFAGFRPFAFAGIWTDGGADVEPNFAILTTEAAPELAAIHGRMPVVLSDTDCGRWLADDCPKDEASAIIGNNRTDASAYKVSSHVNKPEHNDAGCISPAE